MRHFHVLAGSSQNPGEHTHELTYDDAEESLEVLFGLTRKLYTGQVSEQQIENLREPLLNLVDAEDPGIFVAGYNLPIKLFWFPCYDDQHAEQNRSRN